MKQVAPSRARLLLGNFFLRATGSFPHVSAHKHARFALCYCSYFLPSFVQILLFLLLAFPFDNKNRTCSFADLTFRQLLPQCLFLVLMHCPSRGNHRHGHANIFCCCRVLSATKRVQRASLIYVRCLWLRTGLCNFSHSNAIRVE